MKRFSFKPSVTIKGRDFRGLRGFSGKPFHPPMTDIPVGAYVIAPILDIGSLLFKSTRWAPGMHVAAGYVFVLGAVFSLAAVLTGFFDWLTTEKGTQIRRMANSHAWTMIAMTLFVLADLGYRYLLKSQITSDAVLGVLGLVILGLVTLGGTMGGSMVFDFGFNVETATDNHVYHKSEVDIVHPHDKPADETITIPDAEGSSTDK
ncbi:MAG: DUF2231 domain-containing protein [Actinomycetota bacterium]|nr:DUF2231 domain-containing protein [Actinomycetota bacterium]